MRILIALLILTASAYAATINAASCTAANVQTAVNTAVSNDTVQLPACGTPTSPISWGATVVTIPSTKGIIFQGQGVGVTVVSGLLSITTNATVGTRVTAMTFRNSAGSSGGNEGSMTVDTSLGNPAFRIDHIFFDQAAHNADTDITEFGEGSGLIDHCTFTTSDTPNERIHVEWTGPGSSTGWTASFLPGSSSMIFIEDNTFTYSLGGSYFGSSALQSYYGARTVFRHNTLNQMQVDAHGTGGNVGARWWEIYENQFNTCAAGVNQSFYMHLRAGSGVVFNNHHSCSNAGGGGITLEEEDSGCTLNANYSGTCQVANYQVGSGINGQTNGHATCSGGTLNSSPAYFWGNDGTMSVGVEDDSTDKIRINRDYFLSASQPASLLRQEQAGDTCSTTYTYVPFTYPHPLQGASAPTAAVAPSSLTFAGQLVGTTSASQGFSLTNNGSASLTITSIALTGTNSANFSQSNNCGGTLAPGANCTGTVTFTPSATGSRTAAVTFTDNASDSPQALPLSGTGTAPAVTLNPGSLTFAAQDVGTTSPTQPIVLTNSGTAPLGLTSIGLTGTNSGDFAQSNNCPTGATLAVSASCTITVSFSPTLFGSRSASVSIVDSATGSPHTAALTGTARLGIPVGLTVVIH